MLKAQEKRSKLFLRGEYIGMEVRPRVQVQPIVALLEYSSSSFDIQIIMIVSVGTSS